MTLTPFARSALLLLTLSVSAGVPVAVAAQDGGPGRGVRATMVGRAGPASAYRRCERSAVAECQSDAKLDMQLCGPFADRFACAGEALTQLRACWIATGCW